MCAHMYIFVCLVSEEVRFPETGESKLFQDSLKGQQIVLTAESVLSLFLVIF